MIIDSKDDRILQGRFTSVFEDFEQQEQIMHEEHDPIDHCYSKDPSFECHSLRYQSLLDLSLKLFPWMIFQQMKQIHSIEYLDRWPYLVVLLLQ